MKLESGTPMFDGRYLVFVPGLAGWLDPHIVLWQKDRWTFQHSKETYPDHVQLWCGPLPVMKAHNMPRAEYDL